MRAWQVKVLIRSTSTGRDGTGPDQGPLASCFGSLRCFLRGSLCSQHPPGLPEHWGQNLQGLLVFYRGAKERLDTAFLRGGAALPWLMVRTVQLKASKGRSPKARRIFFIRRLGVFSWCRVSTDKAIRRSRPSRNLFVLGTSGNRQNIY